MDEDGLCHRLISPVCIQNYGTLQSGGNTPSDVPPIVKNIGSTNVKTPVDMDVVPQLIEVRVCLIFFPYMALKT